MKCLFIFVLPLSLGTVHAQNTAQPMHTFRKVNLTSPDVLGLHKFPYIVSPAPLDHKVVPHAIDIAETPNTWGDYKPADPEPEPGYYEPAEMVRTTNLNSNLGKLNVNTNYSFNDDGDVHGEEISLKKIRGK